MIFTAFVLAYLILILAAYWPIKFQLPEKPKR